MCALLRTEDARTTAIERHAAPTRRVDAGDIVQRKQHASGAPDDRRRDTDEPRLGTAQGEVLHIANGGRATADGALAA